MPVNNDQQETDTLFLYGAAGVQGTVTSAGGFSATFTVGANGVTSVTIPNTYDLTSSGTVTDFGFKVMTNNAGQNVGASYLSRETYTTDTTYLLNSTALGTSYYAVGAPSSSQLSIVGTKANTTITITPSMALDGGYAAGVPFTVTLGAGQAVLYTGQDVTGTKVVSSAPIAVFGGAGCSQMPIGTPACDHMITAVPSTDNYTTEAVIPTTKGVEAPSSNIVRVLAATNNTVVTYQGATIATLNAGQFYDFRSGPGGGVLTSNKPVLLNEFLTGEGEHSGTPGDPAISFVPGTSQWLSEYLLSTPVGSQAYTDNFLDLAIRDTDIKSLTLNGALVSSSDCTALAGTKYSTCNIAITAGFYDIKAANPFLAMVDGGTDYDSYLTFVGTTFSSGASPSPTVIGTTGGDVPGMPSVFSLSSKAANAATVTFDGGTLLMVGGSFPNNIISSPVVIDAKNGTVDTITGNGGFSGNVSGQGSLTITGGGTFSLTGNNTFAGGTFVNASTVAVGGSSPLGTGTLMLANATVQAVAKTTIANSVTFTGNATVDTQGYGVQMSGAISGAGALVKDGGGTLTLSGANSYSGGTVVVAGTLVAGSATGISSAGSLFVARGATVDAAGYALTTTGFSGSGTVTNSGDAVVVVALAVVSGSVASYDGALADGTGGIALQKTGAGTQVLGGVNSYSGGTDLLEGVLAVGNSAALGSGQLTMAEGTTLAFTSTGIVLPNAIAFSGTADPTIDTGPYSDTISGPITGPAALTKIGTGTLDLTGTNTYTGQTDVAQGTLLVDGSTIRSYTTVESGAVLGGSGTIGGLNLRAGATLAPGAGTPFSTLTIQRNATLRPGSTYFVAVDAAGQSDRTLVGGAAVLNGAKLAVYAAGAGVTPSSRYDILSAASGVTGTFSTITKSGNLPFLTPTLSYSRTDVTLGFVQSAPLSSVAGTPNQAGSATGIQSLGPGNPLYGAVIGLSTAGAQQAFQQTSGETHASASQTAVNAGRVTSSIIFDRLWNLPIPQAGDALDALNQFAPGTPSLLNCYAPTTAPSTGVQQGQGYTVWGQAIGDFGHSNSDGNAAAVDRTLGGFMLGLDSRIDAKGLDNWRVGISGGYTNTQFDVKQGGGAGTYENVFGTVYAGARYGAVTLRLAGTYGGTQTNLTRTVAFPGFLETERSNNGGDTGAVSGEVGYRFQYPQAVIEPIVNGAYTHVHQDSYREKGGAAALVGAAQDIDVESTVLGFRGEALPIQTLPIVARVFLGWQHSYGDINPAATVAFAAGGLSFSSYGVPLDRNAVVAEAGLDYRASTALSLGLTYFGQAGERNTDNAIKGRVEYRF